MEVEQQRPLQETADNIYSGQGSMALPTAPELALKFHILRQESADMTASSLGTVARQSLSSTRRPRQQRRLC